jgi:hypothetical protein
MLVARDRMPGAGEAKPVTSAKREAVRAGPAGMRRNCGRLR